MHVKAEYSLQERSELQKFHQRSRVVILTILIDRLNAINKILDKILFYNHFKTEYVAQTECKGGLNPIKIVSSYASR